MFIHSIADVLDDSEDMLSIMKGGAVTNTAPRTITVPAPRALQFPDEKKKLVSNKKIGKVRNPRMQF